MGCSGLKVGAWEVRGCSNSLLRTAGRSRSRWEEVSNLGIDNHDLELIHLLMVRMARSPRLIWGTPSSQPVRHTLVNNLHAIPTSSTPGAIHATRTLDETANTDGGGQRGATVTGAVEPI